MKTGSFIKLKDLFIRVGKIWLVGKKFKTLSMLADPLWYEMD